MTGKNDNFIQTSMELNIAQTSSLAEDTTKIFCYDRPSNDIDRNSRIHFMNACRTQQWAYTCAVDSFLEICLTTFGSLLKTLALKSEFIELVYTCIDQLTSDNLT